MAFRRLIFALCLASTCGFAIGGGLPYHVRYNLTVPSRLPSGNPVNDLIHLNYYTPASEGGRPVPAVIAIHGIDVVGFRGDYNPLTDPFARYLAEHGVAAVAIELPYHMMRLPPHDNPTKHYLSADPEEIARTMEQCVSDVETVADWLQNQQGIDSGRIGLVGVSLGAIVTHLAMGQDARFKAGVTILGLGGGAEYFEHGLLYKLYHPHSKVDPAQATQILAPIDPITYADRNWPRRVLMIQGDRDMIFPPHYAAGLWKALGRPPLRWVDTNHLGLGLIAPDVWNWSLRYLQDVWRDPSYDGKNFPELNAPAIKFGILDEWRGRLALALQYQLFGIGKRPDHMPWLTANLGVGTRGFFATLGVTLGQHIDAGLLQDLPRGGAGPYVSFHVVF